MSEVRAKIDIAAPPEAVYDVMLDPAATARVGDDPPQGQSRGLR